MEHIFQYIPNRMHPGSARDPIAFFSIIPKNSSILSSLISASTRIQIGMALSDVRSDRGRRAASDEWAQLNCWGAKAAVVVRAVARRLEANLMSSLLITLCNIKRNLDVNYDDAKDGGDRIDDMMGLIKQAAAAAAAATRTHVQVSLLPPFLWIQTSTSINSKPLS